MSIKPMEQAEPWDMVPGVVDEPRDGRTYSEVVMPFVARTDSLILQGTKFSIGGFELLGEATDVVNGDQVFVDHKAFALNDQPFQLRINLSGFVLELAIRAGFVGMEGEGTDQRLLFAITEISPREEQALRRVIRAYLSGQIATADDVMRAMDDPTGTGKPAPKAAPAVVQSTLKPKLVAALSSILCAFILTLSAISIFDKFMIVESSFASVTAPKVDILSPGTGKLKLAISGSGETVARDDPLYEVEIADLTADVALSEARLAFLVASRDRSAPATSQIDDGALTISQIEAVQGVTKTDQNLLRLEDEISLEQGRLKALQLKEAALTDFAPCECSVSWAQEDGAWLVKGEPLMTLARVGPEDLRIEALVDLEEAKSFSLGQTAFVRLRGSSELIEAHIETIMLDGQKRPRVGFPLWLRADHSLGSVTFVMDRPLSPESIGIPLDVFVTDRLPLMHSIREKLGL